MIPPIAGHSRTILEPFREFGFDKWRAKAYCDGLEDTGHKGEGITQEKAIKMLLLQVTKSHER